MGGGGRKRGNWKAGKDIERSGKESKRRVEADSLAGDGSIGGEGAVEEEEAGRERGRGRESWSIGVWHVRRELSFLGGGEGAQAAPVHLPAAVASTLSTSTSAR
jgi:hypothetical protein